MFKKFIILSLLFLAACGTNKPTPTKPELIETKNKITIKNQRDVIIENLVMVAKPGQDRMIEIIDSSNITIRNNHLSGLRSENGHGIIAECNKECNNIVIEGNTIKDMKTGNSETVTLVGNVNGFLIKNNHIENISNIGIDVIGGEDKSSEKDYARNGVVVGNVVKNVMRYKPWTPHFYCDGCKNVVFDSNTAINDLDIYKNFTATGFEVGAENKKARTYNVTLKNNKMVNFHKPSILIGTEKKSDGKVGCIKLENNTFENTKYKVVWQNNVTKGCE